VQPPAPLLFVNVKAAVTPPAGQNKPFLGEDTEAKMVGSIQRMPVNPFRRATKGTEFGKRYYTFQINSFSIRILHAPSCCICAEKLETF